MCTIRLSCKKSNKLFTNNLWMKSVESRTSLRPTNVTEPRGSRVRTYDALLGSVVKVGDLSTTEDPVEDGECLSSVLRGRVRVTTRTGPLVLQRHSSLHS